MNTAVDVMLERRMRPLVGNAQTEPIEHAIGIFAPGDRDRRRADRVFENQIPADDPCDQLAHRGVGISIGAARDRNHRRELGVTQTGKCAADSGDDEGEHDRWTRAIRNCGGRSHEQTRADNRADAEHDQDSPARANVSGCVRRRPALRPSASRAAFLRIDLPCVRVLFRF